MSFYYGSGDVMDVIVVDGVCIVHLFIYVSKKLSLFENRIQSFWEVEYHLHIGLQYSREALMP